jgi:putative modified peptide
MAESTLTGEQVSSLLQKLSTDEKFRALFQSDLAAAFKELPGSPALPPDLKDGCCLKPKKLASAEKIAEASAMISEQLLGKRFFNPHMLE